MISLACVVALAAAQGAPDHDTVVIVTGAVRDGRLSTASLGLGEGGFASGARPRSAGARDRGTTGTVGGALVRARAEGVLLDFPTGAELLVGVSGRVHLRTGGFTDPHSRGLALLLADGSAVTAVPTAGGRRELRSVRVEDRNGARVLWEGRRRHFHRVAPKRFTGDTYLVAGRGDVLYRPMPVGPILVLERVLCSKADRDGYPLHKVVIVGDVLGASLQMLPKLVPRGLAGYPRAHQVAAQLAQAAQYLFEAPLIERPSGAVGEVVLPLGMGSKLKLDVRHNAVVLELHAPDRDVPLIEWTVTSSTTRLHLVLPDGGEDGKPRYAMRGIDLRSIVAPLFPYAPTSKSTSRARRVLRELAGPR